MAVQFLGPILAAVRIGTPVAKIIAKYGKKAYDAVRLKSPKEFKTATEAAKDYTKKGAAGVTGAFVASSFTPSSRVDKKIEAPSKKSPHKD